MELFIVHRQLLSVQYTILENEQETWPSNYFVGQERLYEVEHVDVDALLLLEYLNARTVRTISGMTCFQKISNTGDFKEQVGQSFV